MAARGIFTALRLTALLLVVSALIYESAVRTSEVVDALFFVPFFVLGIVGGLVNSMPVVYHAVQDAYKAPNHNRSIVRLQSIRTQD